MSWVIQNSVNRVFNAFKRNKNNIYKEDIEALKLINEALLEREKTLVNDNILFAKLLSIQLRQNIIYFKDIGLAIKAVQRDLRNTVEFNINLLTLDLNNHELENYFKSIGIHKYDTLQEWESNKQIISDNQQEISKKVLKSWSVEDVEKSFYKSANQIIKDIENYK
jgi:hypothetical protein